MRSLIISVSRSFERSFRKTLQRAISGSPVRFLRNNFPKFERDVPIRRHSIFMVCKMHFKLACPLLLLPRGIATANFKIETLHWDAGMNEDEKNFFSMPVILTTAMRAVTFRLVQGRRGILRGAFCLESVHAFFEERSRKAFQLCWLTSSPFDLNWGYLLVTWRTNLTTQSNLFQVKLENSDKFDFLLTGTTFEEFILSGEVDRNYSRSLTSPKTFPEASFACRDAVFTLATEINAD